MRHETRRSNLEEGDRGMSGMIVIRGYAPGLEHRDEKPKYLSESGATINVLLATHSIVFAVPMSEMKTLHRRVGEFIGIVENGSPKWDKEQAQILATKLGCVRNDALVALFECDWDVAKAEELLIKTGTGKAPVPVATETAEPKAEEPAAKPRRGRKPQVEPAAVPSEPTVEATVEVSTTEVVGPKTGEPVPACPKCGGPTKRRVNKTKGTRFWGCLSYPECKGTVDIGKES